MLQGGQQRKAKAQVKQALTQFEAFDADLVRRLKASQLH